MLIHDAPANLAARLVMTGADRLDIALLPVVEPLLDRRLAIIPGIGVAAEREVRSVLLRSTKPIAGIRSVALDPASRTSNRLVRILAARHFHITPRFLDPNETSEKADAAVVIGDRALTEPPGAAGDIDLGAAWRAMTGLPFVFAVWAHCAGAPESETLAAIARESLEAGLAALPEIAERHAAALGLATATCLDYLEHAVHHRLGPREGESLALFDRLLREIPA